MEKTLKENNEVNKKSNKLVLQKVLVFSLFFSMIALFIYSLLFMTPFYNIYILDGTFSVSNLKTWGYNDMSIFPEASYVKRNDKLAGISLAYFTDFARNGGLQELNHNLFNLSFLGIIVAAVLFIYRTQKRKRFYISNFITVGVVSTFEIGVSIYGLIELIYWQNYMNNYLYYDLLSAYKSDKNLDTELVHYFTSGQVSWIFYLGYAIFFIIIAISVLSIIYMIYKAIYQHKHKAIDVSEVVINE